MVHPCLLYHLARLHRSTAATHVLHQECFASRDSRRLSPLVLRETMLVLQVLAQHSRHVLYQNHPSTR